MKTMSIRNAMRWCAAAVVAAGCGWEAAANGLRGAPVAPQSNEQIIRDQLIILVDESRTIGTGRVFAHEKWLAQFFVESMPEGTYYSGIKSFAGVSSSEWVQIELAPFDRTDMVDGAYSLEPLGHTTPLDRAIYSQRTEVSGIGGRGALLIFSDGRVTDPEAVLQACRDLKIEHGGELCIFTVQVGDSESGRQLLQEMASVNGCGQYYDGATIETAAAMDGVVRDIFFGPRVMAQVAAPAAPTPAPAPMKLTLENVHFENDVDVVHPKYNAQLDEVAAAMAARPEVRLRLHGHTDSNASNAYNAALAERRVQAVAAALIQRGMAASRIETASHGEDMPAVPNTSPENLHMNRRVELTPIE